MPQPRSGSFGAEEDQANIRPYFSLCRFMNDVIPNKNTIDNLESNTRASDAALEIHNDIETDNLDNTMSTDTGLSVVIPLKRTVKDNKMELLIQMENKRLKLIETDLNKSTETESLSAQNPEKQFLLSLLPYFDNLTSLEKLQLRHKVGQVILEFHEGKENIVLLNTADQYSSVSLDPTTA